MVEQNSSGKDREGRERPTCRICQETIKPGALKCTQCGSYQNWRRYLALSSTVLSLLVALVSVLVIGVPVLKKELESKEAEFRITVLNVDERHNAVRLMVANVGTRPGGFQPDLLMDFAGHGSFHQNVKLQTRGTLLVLPGEAEEIEATTDTYLPRLSDEQHKGDDATIRVTIVQFDGTVKTLAVEFKTVAIDRKTGAVLKCLGKAVKNCAR